MGRDMLKPVAGALISLLGVGTPLAAETAPVRLTAADKLEIQQIEATLLRAGNACADATASRYYLPGAAAAAQSEARDFVPARCSSGDRRKAFGFIPMLTPNASGVHAETIVMSFRIDAAGNLSDAHGGQYSDDLVKTPAGWRVKSRVFLPGEGYPKPPTPRDR